MSQKQPAPVFNAPAIRRERTHQPGEAKSVLPTKKQKKVIRGVEKANSVFGVKKGSGKGDRGKCKATLLVEHMLANEGKLLVRTMIDRALLGDPTCMRLAMERLMPPKKENKIVLRVPEIKELQDIPDAMQAVCDQVFSGEISLGEGQNAMSLLRAWAESMALVEGAGKSKDAEDLVAKMRNFWQATNALTGQAPDQEG